MLHVSRLRSMCPISDDYICKRAGPQRWERPDFTSLPAYQLTPRTDLRRTVSGSTTCRKTCVYICTCRLCGPQWASFVEWASSGLGRPRSICYAPSSPCRPPEWPAMPICPSASRLTMDPPAILLTSCLPPSRRRPGAASDPANPSRPPAPAVKSPAADASAAEPRSAMEAHAERCHLAAI